MSIPFDIAALSAQVFQSFPGSDQLVATANGFDGLDQQSIDQLACQLNSPSSPSDQFGLPSLSDLISSSSSSPQVNHPIPDIHHTNASNASNPEGSLPNSLITHQPNPLPEAQQDPRTPSNGLTPPDSVSYHEAGFNDSQVSELIQSLLRETNLPIPISQPCPPPSSSAQHQPAQTIISTPHPTPPHHPPHSMLVDPTLQSHPISSPPTTLSIPHSPQPSLRSDASTSQAPLKNHLSQSNLTRFSTLAPVNIKISSLDQLANPPVGQQPNYPWWTIIRAAIMGSRYGIMTREEIYEALKNRWEYFRSTSEPAARIWKSAVGHNLSVKECFVRVHVEGKRNVSYYIVDTAVDPAKGRLSKSKNPCSSTDRVSVPTISRKLVLPQGFDLSIQARWSPAIAAIRNAKFGIPRQVSSHILTRRARSATSSSDISHTPSESDLTSESESDGSSDQVTEADTTITHYSTPQQPSSLSRFARRPGSSLSAIIEPTSSPRRATQSIPRLAFSRSLSNALVDAPPSSRRRPFGTRNLRPAGNPAPPVRPSISRNSHPSSPSREIHRLVGQQACTASRQPSCPQVSCSPYQAQSSSQGVTSLQDHVDAALADVAASLPQMVKDRSAANFNEQSMMIDVNSSILDPLPEIDLEAIMKEAQAEIQSEENQADPRSYQHYDGIQPHNDPQKSTPSSLVPTAADFDRLLASVISEYEHPGPNNDNSVPRQKSPGLSRAQLPNCQLDSNNEETDPGGLNDLLQSLIDEASYETGQELVDTAASVNETAEQDNCSDAAFMDASKILEVEIEKALKMAEEQEMRRQQMLEQEQEIARQRALSEQVSASLKGVVQLTASGDIPVHPLPLEPIPATTASPTQAEVQAPARKTISRVSQGPHKDANQNKSFFKPMAVVRKQVSTRPTSSLTNICLPAPTIATMATNESLLIDRRTRASGTRTTGRKLNLPLPLLHTIPSATVTTTTTAITVGEDNRVDETALAPSFLESIRIVSVDRPRSTFPELAKEAITSHPHGKMTAAEIFKVLEKKYPYFVTAPESWKATLRNVLTSHSCFVKIPRPADAPGRGDWWSTVDLPLWKRRRTTAKAKQDEDFVGRYTREQSRKIANQNDRCTYNNDYEANKNGPSHRNQSLHQTLSDSHNHDPTLLSSSSPGPAAKHSSSNDHLVIRSAVDENSLSSCSISAGHVSGSKFVRREAANNSIDQNEESQVNLRKRKAACGDDDQRGIDIIVDQNDKNKHIDQDLQQQLQPTRSSTLDLLIDEELLAISTANLFTSTNVNSDSDSKNNHTSSLSSDSDSSLNDSIHQSLQSRDHDIPHQHPQIINDLTVV